VPALAWALLPRTAARIGVGATVAGGAALLAGASGVIAAAVLVLGVIAATVGPAERGGHRGLRLILAAVLTVAGALVIAAYDQQWRLTAWAELPRTAVLVNTLAFAPFTIIALAAARTLATRPRPPAAAQGVARIALVGSIGWLGYVTLPYLLTWGPVLLLLLACLSVLLVRRSFT
jgi:hypothetical protein